MDLMDLAIALRLSGIYTQIINYINTAVLGLWDDRGNYDASGNTFPASGGSGTAGAVMKGDIWTISVAGTLGGVAVVVGDTVRALVDSPAQTAANWAIGATGNIAAIIHGSASKTTPVDADEIGLADSEASFGLKKLTFANLWTWVLSKINGSGGINATTAITSGTVSRIRLPKNRPLKAIPLGDSISLGGTTNLNGLWQFGSSYIDVLIWMSGGRYQMDRNAGIASNTTAQMLARVQSDVIAYAPDICPLLGGTNDLSAGMSNAQIAAMMNNLESIVKALLAANILPVIVTPPPKNSAPTESKNVQIFYYQLAEYYGLPLIDLYRVYVDPTNGNYKSGYTADGTHPNNTAITASASAYASSFKNIETLICPNYMASVSESSSGNLANLMINGAFANGSPIPTGFNGNSAYASLPAASFPYTGVTFTSSAPPAGTIIQTAANITTGFTVGDTLRVSGNCSVSGLTLSSAVGVTLGIAMTGGKNQQPLYGWAYNGSFDFSSDFVVPSGVSTIAFSLYAADAGGTYTLNNMTLINMTTVRSIWQPGL